MTAFKLKPVAIVVIVACAIAAAAYALVGSRAPASDKAAEKPAASPSAPATARPALTVTTTQAQSSALPIKLSANGNIAAWQEASVGTESNGLRLAEVLVNVGDVVQRGQLLARFADDSVQADVAQARAGVAETSAQATRGHGQRQPRAHPAGHRHLQRPADQPVPGRRADRPGARGVGQGGAGRADAAPEEHPGAGAGRRHHLGAQRHRGRGRAQRHRAVSPDPPGAPGVARRGDCHRTGPHAARAPA